MCQITYRIGLKDNQTKAKRIDLNKLTLDSVRGGQFQYMLIGNNYKINLDCYSAFFNHFLSHYSWRVSYIIQFISNYLDPTLVDHLSPYLSVYPIRYPLQLFVSCGSQDSTVQGFSPHKCNQKSSFNAFNAVAAALSQTFPSSYPSNMFVMPAPSSGVS